MVCLLAGEVIERQHQLSGSNPSRVCTLGVCTLGVSTQLISSTWGGFPTLLNNPRIWFRISSIALEEELKVLDFALWLSS